MKDVLIFFFACLVFCGLMKGLKILSDLFGWRMNKGGLNSRPTTPRPGEPPKPHCGKVGKFV